MTRSPSVNFSWAEELFYKRLSIIICNDKMLGRTVVAVHKADLIGLVERMDIDMGMVIEMVNKVCVFDHKHPLRTAAVDKQVGQAQVIGTGELFLRIGAELAVVRGIEKYKIVGRRLVQIKKKSQSQDIL